MAFPLLIPVALAGARVVWAVSRFGVSTVVKNPVKSLVIGTVVASSDDIIEAGDEAISWVGEVSDSLGNCVDDPLICFWDTDLGKVVIIGSVLTASYLIYKQVGK